MGTLLLRRKVVATINRISPGQLHKLSWIPELATQETILGPGSIHTEADRVHARCADDGNRNLPGLIKLGQQCAIRRS
jgi:hypothetical protein